MDHDRTTDETGEAPGTEGRRAALVAGLLLVAGLYVLMPADRGRRPSPVVPTVPRPVKPDDCPDGRCPIRPRTPRPPSPRPR